MPDMRARMRGSFFTSRERHICRSTTMLVFFLLSLVDIRFAKGSCEFPISWTGEWYQYGKQVPVTVNATVLDDKMCLERLEQLYIVYVYSENCYQCIIVNDRHENVIQYREGYCAEKTSVEEMCSSIKSDDTLYSMIRVNSKPIPCPFNGPSFTFTYDKGKGECAMPISLGEKCTDESRLLLKYQACPDIERSESNTEELQCLAVWNDGRNKYLVGTLKGRSVSGAEKMYRCFLYEEKTHHQGKVLYILAQSGEPTCNGLTTVSEGSPTIKLTKVDKEHNKCKYPSWITEHHDWHTLDGTKVYHFTNKNATLKVKVQSTDEDTYHEEKIVCHNLETLSPSESAQGRKVKLIAHVTSGCDIGYVCMIFHKRDHNIIELQQSDQKAIMPDEACSIANTSAMPYTTLISSALRPKDCPNPGRYLILRQSLISGTSFHRQRRSEKHSRIKHDDEPGESHEQRQHQQPQHHHHHYHHQHEQHKQKGDDCKSSSIQIGCASPNHTEIVIGKSCDVEETTYYCHGSWEENGTWYTVVSLKTNQATPNLGQTHCFSMRFGGNRKLQTNGKINRAKISEQEIWFTKLNDVCRREQIVDEGFYTLVNQGVCEDVTKAYSSLASLVTQSRILFIAILANCATYLLLLR